MRAWNKGAERNMICLPTSQSQKNHHTALWGNGSVQVWLLHICWKNLMEPLISRSACVSLVQDQSPPFCAQALAIDVETPHPNCLGLWQSGCDKLCGGKERELCWIFFMEKVNRALKHVLGPCRLEDLSWWEEWESHRIMPTERHQPTMKEFLICQGIEKGRTMKSRSVCRPSNGLQSSSPAATCGSALSPSASDAPANKIMTTYGLVRNL